jgi:predicted HNH restriction endonuclease
MLGYPKNWKQIADLIKQQSGYCCQKCQLQCLTPGQSYHHLSRKIRSRYTIQVHHRDRQPANNQPDNLIAVCSGCHLFYHRGRQGNITPGQLSLNLQIEPQSIQPPTVRHQLGLAIEIERVSSITRGFQLYLLREV